MKVEAPVQKPGQPDRLTPGKVTPPNTSYSILFLSFSRTRLSPKLERKIGVATRDAVASPNTDTFKLRTAAYPQHFQSEANIYAVVKRLAIITRPCLLDLSQRNILKVTYYPAACVISPLGLQAGARV